MTMKLLIVDDEPVICQGLRYTIPWDELGVSVVGEAYSGKQALVMARELDVDIIITDVSMPGMNGIELVQELKLNKIDIKVIIISGYEEFEYARQAVRLGVRDYLMKPVEVEVLEELVKSVVIELHQERERWKQGLIQAIKGTYDTESETSASSFTYRIITSQLEHDSTFDALFDEKQRKIIQSQWVQKMEQPFLNRAIICVSFFFHWNLLVTCCFNADIEEISASNITDILTEASSKWDGPSQLYMGISNTFHSLHEAHKICVETVSSLKNKVNYEVPFMFNEKTVDTSVSAAVFPNILDFEQRLFLALLEEQHDDIEHIIREMIGHFKEKHYMLETVLNLYVDMRFLILKKFRESGFKGIEHSKLLDVLKVDIYEMNTYFALEKIIRQDIYLLLSMTRENNSHKKNWVIDKAKKYVIEHCRHDIKASQVASWLNITPSYFSFIFKQQIGKGFNEYLTELRIERAKKLLLETNDRVYEISDQVGYKKYKYFVLLFKMKTGLTPTEFRDKNIGGADDL
jgi:two-component system response regulator YesN